MPELRTGLPARVVAQAVAARSYDCRVKRIAPIVDPKSGTVNFGVSDSHLYQIQVKKSLPKR